MSRMLIVNELKLVNQINYLHGLEAIHIEQEQTKNEAIAILNWIFLLGIKSISGLLVNRDTLEKELNWLDSEITKHDTFQDYEVSIKYGVRIDQINWLIKEASEPTHPSETSKIEKTVYDWETNRFVPGVSTWNIDKNSLKNKRPGITCLPEADFPDFPTN